MFLEPTSMSKRLTILCTLLAVILTAGAVVLAQEGAAAPANRSPAPAPNVSISRSYWFEIVLVVVFAGGAIWSVCRSSNRQ
jgi:hypothetical protein